MTKNKEDKVGKFGPKLDMSSWKMNVAENFEFLKLENSI